MHRRTVIAQGRWQKTAGVMFSIALSAVTTSLFAQAAAKPERLTLGQAFDAAWSQQPEVASLAMRRDAAQAHQRAAKAWTPEPPALEVTGKTDRLGSSLGTREYEIGLTVPLWLPRERGSSQALAEAESRAVESRTTAAQLRVAAAVREAWWNWQRAAVELATAQDQLDSAQRIALDVGKRLKAGDLARADQHQADGAVAAAQATVAGAEAASSVARQALAALMATPATHAKLTLAEPYAEPTPDPSPIDLSAHGDFQWLRDRAAVAQGVVALTATQSRASPELKIATTRGRGAAGEAWQQTVTVGVRIPFGAGPRYDARLAAARAESVELEALMTLERARLSGERDTAKARVEAARLQLVAADRRAQLARESRGFFDKSFRLGESDLPTRLRIEAEATDADRQAARARIELAAAISAWRQALGLLPQ
ncbi:TolC family protein [Roseateles sp. BYS180W]|uniref:TolC family protein n=2 Tax=Roseateles rivi TaxID=3299028 RepID=A0ABW7FZ07_9BURK